MRLMRLRSANELDRKSSLLKSRVSFAQVVSDSSEDEEEKPSAFKEFAQRMASRVRSLYAEVLRVTSFSINPIAHGQFLSVWKGMILAGHLLLFVLIPLQLGWTHFLPPSSKIGVLQVLIDIILLIDCFVDSRTSVEDDFGN
ncbi:hypothetical protein HDU67_002965, partial [Dinochytrium kinnereticum]